MRAGWARSDARRAWMPTFSSRPSKLLAQVGIDVAGHAGVIVEALVNTVWNGWDQMGQTEDLNTIATSTPTLHIAAAPASSGQSSGSGSGKSGGGGGGASGPGGPTSTPGGPSPVPAGSGRILISPCLNLRARTNGSTALVGCVPQNTIVPIDCTAQGNSVTGPYGPTTLWDHTTYQGTSGYVSDAYVYTGTSGAVAGSCASASYPTGRILISPCLNLRAGPNGSTALVKYIRRTPSSPSTAPRRATQSPGPTAPPPCGTTPPTKGPAATSPTHTSTPVRRGQSRAAAE